MTTLQNMEKFKNYFKFPLKMWTDFDVKVFTDDNNMAFDWLINVPREVKQFLVDKINGVNTNPYKTAKEYWHDKGIIRCRILDGKDVGKEYNLCRIRGWGMLIGVGGYNLDGETAAQIQNDFAEYCVKMLNNNE